MPANYLRRAKQLGGSPEAATNNFQPTSRRNLFENFSVFRGTKIQEETMRTVTSISVSLLLAVAASGATAQQLPAEGKFSISYTLTNSSPVKPISIGKDKEFTVSSSMMTGMNDAGSGLLHNMTGRCLSAVVTDKAAKTIEGHGYCTYADADGDQVFEKTDYNQPSGPTILIQGQWIGGTGKFTGLEGTFEIHHSPLKAAVDGTVQGVGKKIGTYKIKTM
ncbi:hypothetical protein ACFFWD_25720 [Bradyrhizobium erythrophlei]|uniref:hypothetical protein n=1 Tax=Bradyrhizobium erythrophlei TaxID=1437360 RepID=UPI0035EE875F